MSAPFVYEYRTTDGLPIKMRIAANSDGTYSPVSGSPVYDTRIAYDGSGNQTYIGKALPGTATSAALWQVGQFVRGTAGLITGILLLDSGNFDLVWDSYAGGG